jgi:hypothetical protein
MLNGNRRRLAGLLITVVALALALGCGHNAPATVPQAIHLADGPVQVQGYIIINPRGEARICEGLLGSYPPQCGGAWLTVEGLDADTLPGRQTDQGVVWTGRTVLHGTKQGNSVRVS